MSKKAEDCRAALAMTRSDCRGKTKGPRYMPVVKRPHVRAVGLNKREEPNLMARYVAKATTILRIPPQGVPAYVRHKVSRLRRGKRNDPPSPRAMARQAGVGLRRGKPRPTITRYVAKRPCSAGSSAALRLAARLRVRNDQAGRRVRSTRQTKRAGT